MNPGAPSGNRDYITVFSGDEGFKNFSSFLPVMDHVTKTFINQNEVEIEAVKKEFKDKTSKDLDFLVRFVLLPRDDKTLGAFLKAVPISTLTLSSLAAERNVGSNSAQVRTPTIQ